MPELIRPGARVRYEVWGESGPWTTLINGYTRPLNDFRLLGRFLQERGLRVLALDNRGAGETQIESDFSLRDMVDDVAALWQHLGITTTRLLGISMGGFIAQQLTLTLPAQVARLALVSTAASHSLIRDNDIPWSNNIEAVLTKLAPYFTESFYQRNQILVKSMAKQIAKGVSEGSFAERAQRQKAAVHGFDVRSQLAEVACSTLIVHGAEDRIIPVEAAYELERTIPDSKLMVCAGAGHLLLAEKPRELYEAVAAAFI